MFYLIFLKIKLTQQIIWTLEEGSCHQLGAPILQIQNTNLAEALQGHTWRNSEQNEILQFSVFSVLDHVANYSEVNENGAD